MITERGTIVGKSLAELTAEIRIINIEKGWRPAEGGPGDRTFGDYLALLHSEVSEALEAFRDHGVADVTGEFGNGECTWAMSESSMAGCDVHGYEALPKPEGVGSELADVLIRLLDMCDVFGLTPFDMDCELADVEHVPLRLDSLGGHMALLHSHFASIGTTMHPVPAERDLAYRVSIPRSLRTLVTVADVYGIDLTAEVDRKVAYNRTRSFRHGGRAL